MALSMIDAETVYVAWRNSEGGITCKVCVAGGGKWAISNIELGELYRGLAGLR
jgi:hypothetical protein